MGELLWLTTKILTLNRVFWASVVFMQTAGDRSFTLTPTCIFWWTFATYQVYSSGWDSDTALRMQVCDREIGHFPLPSTINSISGGSNCRACLLFSLPLKHRRACSFRQKVRKLAARTNQASFLTASSEFLAMAAPDSLAIQR